MVCCFVWYYKSNSQPQACKESVYLWAIFLAILSALFLLSDVFVLYSILEPILYDLLWGSSIFLTFSSFLLHKSSIAQLYYIQSTLFPCMFYNFPLWLKCSRISFIGIFQAGLKVSQSLTRGFFTLLQLSVLECSQSGNNLCFLLAWDFPNLAESINQIKIREGLNYIFSKDLTQASGLISIGQ